jgi:hypothetical protein
MKVIIYQANQEVPFDNFFKPLGNHDKIFFSNTKYFDKEQVKVLLPDEEDNSVFVVPDSWKDGFHQLLKEKFPKVEWQKEQSHQKPPKEEIGSGWSEELAKFYDKEIQETEIWSGEDQEQQLEAQVNNEYKEDSVQLLNTFLPLTIPIIIFLFLIMVWFKPAILDMYRGQIPNMLKRADQSLETNIEETSYWAEDRILKIYRQDYPNAEKTKIDENNISEAEALVEAVTEVETALLKEKELGVKPLISKLEQRELATQLVMNNPQEQELYTLQIAHMSTTELEKWLEKLSDEILKIVFVYKVEDNEKWKVTYGNFEKIGKQGDIPTNITEMCCKYKEFGYGNKTIGGLLRSFPPEFPQKIGKTEKTALVELINNVSAISIPQDATGLYIPANKFVYLCPFSKLGNC